MARGNPSSCPRTRPPAGFNPPPARWPGETKSGTSQSIVPSVFQSAPGPMARGNGTAPCFATRPARFQSAPGPNVRGNPQEPITDHPARMFSIRPRPDGQGNPIYVLVDLGGLVVSIRPRPDGQGNSPVSAETDATSAFQSAPGPMARGN